MTKAELDAEIPSKDGFQLAFFGARLMWRRTEPNQYVHYFPAGPYYAYVWTSWKEVPNLCTDGDEHRMIFGMDRTGLRSCVCHKCGTPEIR